MRLAIAFSLASILSFSGCSTQLPPVTKSMPLPCEVKVRGECQSMSASEKGGAGSRGHTEEPRNDKLMFYVPPEELWPEDFKPAPKVCASPFQGNQLLR